MAGFTGAVRVISDWIGNCAYNTAHLFVNCVGQSVYETASIFVDRLKRLICFLTPEPVKRTAKYLMNRRRWRNTGLILISLPVLYVLYMLCYAAYIKDLYLFILLSLVFGYVGFPVTLVRLICSSRNLYKQKHTMERLEFFRTCLSECATCFGTIIISATSVYMTPFILLQREFSNGFAIYVCFLCIIAIWLVVIGQLLQVLNSLTDHKWYHIIAVALGVIILTVVYISTYYLICIYSASVLFHGTVWLVITFITVSIYVISGAGHHQLYKDLLFLIFYLSIACMYSIISYRYIVIGTLYY